MNDYKVWYILYHTFPKRLIECLFTIYTAIQLYFLGARYVLKEIQRKLSDKIRKLRPYGEPDIPDNISGYIAVVTGGSRGIGLSAAKDLFRRGAIVIVTSSATSELERKKVAEEAQLLNDNTLPTVPGGKILVWPIDFRSMSSVYEFVSRFNNEYKHLDILINNAGVMFVDKQYTIDRFEYHYQINYLSHVLLTWLLMPALNRAGDRSSDSRPGRVVNVSSSTHYARPLFIEDLQSFKSPYSPFHAYAQSKLCQIMFTYYMSDWLERKKLKQSGFPECRVLVNSLHPGVAMTGLYQNVWWVKLFPRLASFLFRTADEGAETVIYLALSTEVKTSGNYYEDCSILKSSSFSLDKSMQYRLAEITLKQLETFVNEFNSRYREFKVPHMVHI